MEHWQFLIQKQGDRSWHTLESPNIQILEGRYRVLARSNLPNTDVEVRVTHSSTQEVPPKRRIQKQSRRTNSEGLMAVIPFTQFKLGIWEVRCSGDLMSDILGNSWQYSIHLQVLSQLPNRELGKLTGGGNVESDSLDFFMIQLPEQHSSHELESVTGSNLFSNSKTGIIIPIGTETNTHSNLSSSELPQEFGLLVSDNNTISTAEEITESDVVTSEIPSEAVDRTIFNSTEEVTDTDVVTSEIPSEEVNPTISNSTDEITEPSVITSEILSDEITPTISNSIEEITGTDVVNSEISSEEVESKSDRTIFNFTEEITGTDVVNSEIHNEEIDRTISNSTEEIADTDVVTSELPSSEVESTSDTISASTDEITETDVFTSELPSSEAELTSDTISPCIEEMTDSDAVTSELTSETEEYAIIDQPVSPVWLKGETAEQILQNLMELALPTAELLLDDEELEEDPTIQPAPPLLLTLEQENYIARWGQGLSINAKVQLQANITLEDEPQYATNLHALEVRIELRSPLSSETLAQVRQPLAENSLPLTINTAINIPADCGSKLLLGELSLYGALTDFGEVMLLASRPFTVTAEVTELLAITAVTKLSQQNFLESGAFSVSVPNKESAASVNLGLELFNLVKTSPNQPQTILPSPSQPLPPQVSLLSLKKTGDERSPKLPKLPEIPTSAIAIDDVMAELPTQEKEEFKQNDEVVLAPTTIPLAPINLEQLSIKNRRKLLLGNTFPYLKRIDTLPAEEAEATANISNESDISVTEDSVQPSSAVAVGTSGSDESDILVADDSQQFALADTEHENLVHNTELPNDFVAEVLAESIPEVEKIPTLELSDDSIAQPTASLNADNSEVLAESVPEVTDAQSLGFSDNSITKPSVPLNSQLIGEGNPYSSPLIRKWMQSQGYFVPEPPPPPVQYQNQETDVSEPQNAALEQEPLEPSLAMSSVDSDLWSEIDVTSETSIGTEIIPSEENLASELWGEPETSLSEENLASELWGEPEISIITQEAEDLQISAETKTENIPQEVSTSSLQLPQLALSQKIKIPRAWLAQEIVVDDTYSESEESPTQSIGLERKQPSNSPVSSSAAIETEINEPLPIPQLHIPEGELVAGQSVRVRIELPEVPPQVVVKLWIEDCQTRGLLDGPHLLKDLLPNLLGGVEVMTQINIPFGCVEIRIEAIAFNTSTQQESHKVTVMRTVIPPDLPNLQVDELLGM